MLDTILIVVFLAGVVSIPVLILLYTLITGIPPMPTMPWTLRKILPLVPDPFSGTLYELGSGWGGPSIALARFHPQARIIGIERSPLPLFWSRTRAAFAAIPNVEFRRRDLFEENFHDADVLFCYLSPEIMIRLKEKCERELRPGTLLISHAFAMPGWTPSETKQLPGIYPTPIYLYRIPE